MLSMLPCMHHTCWMRCRTDASENLEARDQRLVMHVSQRNRGLKPRPRGSHYWMATGPHVYARSTSAWVLRHRRRGAGSRDTAASGSFRGRRSRSPRQIRLQTGQRRQNGTGTEERRGVSAGRPRQGGDMGRQACGLTKAALASHKIATGGSCADRDNAHRKPPRPLP